MREEWGVEGKRGEFVVGDVEVGEAGKGPYIGREGGELILCKIENFEGAKIREGVGEGREFVLVKLENLR